MKDKKNTETCLLIVTVAVLFLLMLVLCGLYLDLRINGINSSLPGIPEQDRWIISGERYEAKESSDEILSPYFLGIRTEDGKLLAASLNETSRKGILNQFNKCMKDLFSGDNKKIKFASEEEKNVYINELINEKEYMYASYFGEIPAAAVVPCLSGGKGNINLSNSFYFKHIFILPDENEKLYAVCVSETNDVYEITPMSDTEFNILNIDAYNDNRGFEEFEFYKGYLSPVFKTSFDVDTLISAPSFSFYDFNNITGPVKELLLSFDFNTNMTKTFKSVDGSTVSFVDAGKEILINLNDGSFSFEGKDIGIPFSMLLEYKAENAPTFTETVLAVKYFLSSVKNNIMGGDAAPTLVGVTEKDGKTVFSFKYFYNGIMITENDEDIVIETEDSFIKRVEIKTLFCVGGIHTKPVLPQKQAISMLESEFSENTMLYGMYKIGEKADNVEFVWVARKRGEE